MKLKTKSRKDWYFVILQLLIFLAYFLGKNSLQYPLPSYFVWLGISFKIFGLVCILIAVIQFKLFLSPFPSPKEGQLLVTNGIFSFMRHPIYTGIFFYFLGSGIASGSVFTISVSIFFIAFAYIKASYEEKLLLKKLPVYKQYKQKTRMFL